MGAGSRKFWEGCKQGQLWLPRCRRCGGAEFSPRDECPSCGSADLEWRTHSGRARLYSYVKTHPAPGLPEPEASRIIAVVQLEEGPRMMASLEGLDPEDPLLRVDIPLLVTFEAVGSYDGGEAPVPRFRPA